MTDLATPPQEHTHVPLRHPRLPSYAPWLAVQDQEAAYGVALEWPGNWHITAEAEPGGSVRVRAGRVPHEGAVLLAPGDTLVTPRLASSGPRTARSSRTDKPQSSAVSGAVLGEVAGRLPSSR